MRFHKSIVPAVRLPDGRSFGVLPRKENLAITMKRIDALWGNYDRMKQDPRMLLLFDRVTPYVPSEEIDRYLFRMQYPPRTLITELHLDSWSVSLNTKFIRAGCMYLFRGDNPGLTSKGFYSKVYGYSKYSTKQLEFLLENAREVGYFLYESELFLTHPMPSYAGIAEELMYSQSAIGGSSFVSATTSIPCAVAGSGVRPERGLQSAFEVYIVKVPVGYLINSNTDNFFGINEDEVLVADYISSSEIVATFARTDTEGMYRYMHKTLGVTRKDMRMGETGTRGKRLEARR